ncbi:MAG TPA: polyphosphate kinase [Dongiaceae bacterium]|nr:polyphosphate kinase [Dongiaceae bacterium]
MAKKIRLSKLRRLSKIDFEVYESKLIELQHRLERVQHAQLFTGDRGVIVFEGMDAAGKGGAIRRIAWALDPRSLKVWPIGAPDAIEKQQHYLQRFWTRMPSKGQLAIFDRSWYGRVLVERVEAFAKPAEWKRAYSEINEFERQLADEGIRVIKIFLHITKDEQLRRFEERLRNPLKRWKLSYEDFRNRDKWDAYVTAIEDMFDRTSTKLAPWHAIQGDSKQAARLEVMRLIIDRLAEGIDIGEPPIDARVLKIARKEFGPVKLEERRGRQRKH